MSGQRNPYRRAVEATLLGAWLALAGCAHSSAIGAAADDAVSPFPLVAGSLWVYDGAFAGRSHRLTLELQRRLLAGKAYFAFVDPGAKAASLLTGNMFGGDLFRREGPRIVVADELAGRPRTLVELPIEAGQAAAHVGPGYTMRTLVRGPEPVQVPAGRFEAIRIDTVTELPDGRVLEGALWLAPGVGLVKWQRETGRVDVLVTYRRGPARR